MPPAVADTGLPVEQAVDAIRAALGDRGVAVLAAEPGAGKTTVVPLRLLEEPWLDARQRIVMLEPRRLATRAAAHRMASLLGQSVGDLVGYRTRDDRRVGRDTRLEVVTEGMLTRRLQRDPALDRVGLVIFDEFHERSLQADLGLALTLEAREHLRPDLRLLVMSATLDTVRVAELLGGDGAPAPIVQASGRQYPVDVRWAPRGRKDRVEPAVVDAVLEVLATEAEGDVLVFLAGAAQIRRVVGDLARRTRGRSVDVLPLFGAMPQDEQQRALEPAPAGRRKVVVSTDIAETSLTVVGVRHVVDAGLRREPRHDLRTGMSRLETVSTSRASAEQRAGRAGRTEPGTAVRLWSKMEQATRPAHTPPEMATADLSGLALELAAWGTAPSDLAFLDPPDPRGLATAQALLEALGAIDGDGRLTDRGRDMVTLPTHPRLSAMVIEHRGGRDGWLACVVAALVDERDVLGGRPDEVPVDLGLRVRLVTDLQLRHERLDEGARRRVARTAADLARRAHIDGRDIDVDHVGVVLASAYPDRVARARSGVGGRFLLASGSGAWLAPTDPLARERFLVVADLDGDRREARIRRAAALDTDDLDEVFADRMPMSTTLFWDRDRGALVRRERRLGAIDLQRVEERPEPSAEVVALVIDHLRSSGLGQLRWSPAAVRLQARVGLLRSVLGDDSWPALDDRSLRADLDTWLVPFLSDVVTVADLAAVDVHQALMNRVGWHRQRELQELLPAEVTLPSGRSVTVDYDRDPPVISGRVQEFFGSAETPTVLDGALPLTVELLSPADRPVQITADLAGFWTGSWSEVRKEMAGRYPKHRWPEHAHEAPAGRR